MLGEERRGGNAMLGEGKEQCHVGGGEGRGAMLGEGRGAVLGEGCHVGGEERAVPCWGRGGEGCCIGGGVPCWGRGRVPCRKHNYDLH